MEERAAHILQSLLTYYSTVIIHILITIPRGESMQWSIRVTGEGDLCRARGIAMKAFRPALSLR
jgi:hypothetical protein